MKNIVAKRLFIEKTGRLRRMRCGLGWFRRAFELLLWLESFSRLRFYWRCYEGPDRRIQFRSSDDVATNELVAATGGGLGNRLKCLITAMRLGDTLGCPVRLYWPLNAGLNCPFDHLFEPIEGVTLISEEECNQIRRSGARSSRMIDTWRLETLQSDGIPRGWSRAYPSPTGRHIDCEYDRIPQRVRNVFLPYFKRLRPISPIKKKVEEFSALFDDKTVSVAVRSWKDEPARQKMFSIGLLGQVLDHMGGRRFFLSSDSDDVIREISTRYPQRVFVYPKRTTTGDRQTVEGMQDNLVDLLLLSRNKYFVVSAWSTFPETAWWFGGAAAGVTVIPWPTIRWYKSDWTIWALSKQFQYDFFRFEDVEAARIVAHLARRSGRANAETGRI